MIQYVKWYKQLSNTVCQHELSSWIKDKGSLTDRLIQHHRDFSVRVMRQTLADPYPDEWQVIGLPRAQKIMARDVLLLSHDRPRVFAHSVVARHAQAKWHFLSHLGNRSLGSKLFSDPSICRGVMTFSRLGFQHTLCRQLLLYLLDYPTLIKQIHLLYAHHNYLLARRSIFLKKNVNDTLLVTEVFLPNCLTKEESA